MHTAFSIQISSHLTTKWNSTLRINLRVWIRESHKKTDFCIFRSDWVTWHDPVEREWSTGASHQAWTDEADQDSTLTHLHGISNWHTVNWSLNVHWYIFFYLGGYMALCSISKPGVCLEADVEDMQMRLFWEEGAKPGYLQQLGPKRFAVGAPRTFDHNIAGRQSWVVKRSTSKCARV